MIASLFLTIKLIFYGLETTYSFIRFVHLDKDTYCVCAKITFANLLCNFIYCNIT